MVNFIKMVYNKVMARRREIVEDNKGVSIQVGNEILILLRRHLGIGLILTIYLAITISIWSDIVKNKNDLSVSVIPLKLVGFLLIPISATLVIYLGVTFFKQHGCFWGRVFSFMYNNIISPVIQEFDANITGFILTNILIMISPYARNWDKILNAWSNNRHHLIVVSIIILLGAIIVPLLANFMFKLVDILISSR